MAKNIQPKTVSAVPKNTTLKLKKYRNLHRLDKTLDIVLISSILVGFALFIAEIFFSPTSAQLRIIKSVDIFILFVFLADITRTFLKSKGILNFLKHAWLDLAVLTLVIVSYSTVFFLGMGRLSWLFREEKVAFLLEDEKLALLFREEKTFSWINRIWKVAFFRKIFRKRGK